MRFKVINLAINSRASIQHEQQQQQQNRISLLYFCLFVLHVARLEGR